LADAVFDLLTDVLEGLGGTGKSGEAVFMGVERSAVLPTAEDMA
jgi:hypothetical protein